MYCPSPLRVPVVALLTFLAAPFLRADIPPVIKPVGLGLGGYSYWSTSPFANTLLSAGAWIEFGTDWGTTTHFLNANGTPNPQFNTNGLPQYLNPGRRLRVLVWPFDQNLSGAPASWPKRGNTGAGKWVVTWRGDADIRLQGASFVSAESSGGATGRLVNGRRVYQMSAANPTGHLTVEAINAADPLTDLKVWLPDPTAPTERSLEGSGSIWHPAFLAYLRDLDFNHLRFMDWIEANASPQQDWADRRRPDFVMQQGVLNRRSPANGFSGNRSTGIAYEHAVALCNLVGKDLWITVPHLATDEYIAWLANLILHGSDGVEPYAGPQANPVHPPLRADLRVWLEYSNEIWSSGNSFAQGNWAQDQATAAGITKPQFNARRAARIWQIFQERFGGSERLVRVAAIWTGQSSYTTPFLTELRNFGPTLNPPVAVDVVSPTTYFGNGIQDWAYEQANLAAGTPGQWFHTASNFTSGTVTRPVSVPLSDAYWDSPLLAAQQAATFVEWKKRIFSGSTAAGGGPDATGVGGGFDAGLRASIQSIFGQSLPIVAYEGGPSLYSDYYDGGDVRDDGISNFLVALNRLPAFAEIYRIQLNMAQAKGLTSHSMFVDVSRWGKYGQWGHLEYLEQPPSTAVKWMAVKDWAAEFATLRPVDHPLGARAQFVTPGTLPAGAYGEPYAQDVVVAGGDVAPGGRPRIAAIGSQLAPGLTLAPAPGDAWRNRVSGTPRAGGWNYFYLRASDDDGDATWQVFSFYVAGGAGTLVEARLTGVFSGVASLPWTNVYVLDSAALSGWSGLQVGAPFASGGGSATGSDGRGVQLHADTNAIRFSVSQGSASQSHSTLASAITDDEYWKFTLTPQAGQPLDLRRAEFRLAWLRTEYHCPRYFAVFSSVGGVAEGQQIYTLPRTPDQGAVTETVFRLPDDAAYAELTGPIEFRLYFYGSQYAHKAQLLGLKLARALPAQPPVFTPDPVTKPNAAVGQPYSETLAGSAVDAHDDLVAYTKLSGPAWLSIASDGHLSGTPTAADAGTNSFTVRAQALSGLSATGTLRIVVLPPGRLGAQFDGTEVRLDWLHGWLLEAPAPTGPWITNVAARAPHFVQPLDPQRYFRLLLPQP